MPRLQRAFSHEWQTQSTQKMSHCLSSPYKCLDTKLLQTNKHKSLSLSHHSDSEGEKNRGRRGGKKRAWGTGMVLGQSATTRPTASQSHFSFAKHRFKDAAHLDKPGMSTHHRLASGLWCPTPGTHFNSAAVKGIFSAAAVQPYPSGAYWHSPQKESSICWSMLSSLLFWLPGSLVQN